MLLRMYLFPLMSFLFFSATNSDGTNHKKITVIGIAMEDKAGTIVSTSGGNYFLDGLDDWNETYLGKKVKVTGME